MDEKRLQEIRERYQAGTTIQADVPDLIAEIKRLRSELLTRDFIWLPAKDAEIWRLRQALDQIAQEACEGCNFQNKQDCRFNCPAWHIRGIVRVALAAGQEKKANE